MYEAQGLELSCSKEPSPYVKFTVKSNRGGTKIQRSNVQQNTRDPKWPNDQIFVFESPVFPAKCQIYSKTPKDESCVPPS